MLSDDVFLMQRVPRRLMVVGSGYIALEFAGIFNFEVAFPAGTVFRWYTFIGLLGVVVWSIVTVLLTLLFNLVNDVTGGIEVVLAERERRPRAS